MLITLLVLARAMHFGSGMSLAGVAAFRWLVLEPSDARPPGAALGAMHQRLRLIYFASIPALGLSELLLFWITTAQMTGASLLDSLDWGTLSAVLLQTHFGTVCLVRVALLGLLILAWAISAGNRAKSSFKRVCESFGGTLAFALWLSNAWAGHAAAGADSNFSIRIALDASHLLATAVWPGGLLFFALLLGQVRAYPEEKCADIGPIVERFSAVSFIAVLALSLTGFGNAFTMIGSFHALLFTAYGQILDLKLSLLAVILALAARNRWRLLPAFATSNDQVERRRILERLRRFVWAEFGLAVAIGFVVSLLGVTPPPR